MASKLKLACAKARRAFADYCAEIKLLEESTEMDSAGNNNLPSQLDSTASNNVQPQLDTADEVQIVTTQVIIPTHTATTVPFRFMSLAPELRNRIYSFALVEHKRDNRGKRLSIPMVQPSLTRVSRAVRSESLLLFYSTNHFHLSLDAEPVAADRVREEHQRLRFLRGLQRMVRAGHVRLMPEITVTYLVGGTRVPALDRLQLAVELYNERPVVYNHKDYARNRQKLPAKDHVWHWEVERLNHNTRTNWSVIESVESAMEVHSLIWSVGYVVDGRYDLAGLIGNMPTGRLCEVLHILQRGRHWPDQTAPSARRPADPAKFVFIAAGIWELMLNN